MDNTRREQINKWKERSYSWSQHSSFLYDPEQWYKKYILEQEQSTNAQMLYGNEIGNKLSNNPSFLPEVLRYSVFEQKLEAKIENIKLIGFLDSFDPVTCNFYEYKTSSNKTKWTNKSVKIHGQLDFYFFLIWMNYKVPPEKIKCKLFYIPVEQGGDFNMKLSNDIIQSFNVNKKMIDILKFVKEIKKVHRQMELYAISHL